MAGEATFEGDQRTDSFGAYRSMLGTLVSVGRTPGPVSAGGNNDVELCHDIDLEPSTALEMAEIEAEYGIEATYFVSPSTPAYDCLRPTTNSIVNSISDLGHEIGLRIDGSADAIESVDESFSMLERLIERTVPLVSIRDATSVVYDLDAVKGENVDSQYRDSEWAVWNFVGTNPIEDPGDVPKEPVHIRSRPAFSSKSATAAGTFREHQQRIHADIDRYLDPFDVSP